MRVKCSMACCMLGTVGNQGAAMRASRWYFASGEMVPTDVVALTCGHPKSERDSLTALLREQHRAAPHRNDTRKTPGTGVTFGSLGVPAPLAAALASGGITQPFPIQAAVLPDALAGRDILGRGRTGSGKTLAFSIPPAARLAGRHTTPCRPRGLLL